MHMVDGCISVQLDRLMILMARNDRQTNIHIKNYTMDKKLHVNRMVKFIDSYFFKSSILFYVLLCYSLQSQQSLRYY